jgi:hypothetical protein
MSRKVKLTLWVILPVVVLAVVWLIASNLFTIDTLVSPGDIVINELSSAGADWVTLRNNTDKIIDLSGYTFTDGDNRFVFPNGSALHPEAEKRIAASKDKGQVPGIVDHYWDEKPDDKKWGIDDDGEFVLLLNNEGSLVVDFVVSPRLEKGQILKRIPPGKGKLQLSNGKPNGKPVEQLQKPTFRAVSIDVINGAVERFIELVIFSYALLGFIAGLITNYETVRDFTKRLLGIKGSGSS